jgi:cysteine synthase A
MIRRLRQSRPTARLVAVDAVCSVLFGRMDGPREFPGMGNSIMPPLLDHTAFNEVHWVPDNLIAHFSKETARRTGLLLGPSGAAALLVARWWARQHKDTRVACVLPDQGTRYLDTLYANDAADVSDRAMLVSDKPAFVRTPQTQSNCWEAMLWGQRSLKQVVQHAAL